MNQHFLIITAFPRFHNLLQHLKLGTEKPLIHYERFKLVQVKKCWWLYVLMFSLNNERCNKIFSSRHTHQDPYRGMVGQGNHLSLSSVSLLVQVAWLLGSVQAQWAPHCSCVGTWDVASLSWCCPREPSCQTWNQPCWVWTCHCSGSVQLQTLY